MISALVAFLEPVCNSWQDKSLPNDLRTAKRVVESIQDDLNEEDKYEQYLCRVFWL